MDSDYATKLLGCWDAMATPESQIRAPGTVAGEIPNDSEHRHLRTAIAFTNTVRSSQACSEDAFFADEGLEGRLWEAIASDVREANPDRNFLDLDVDHVDGNTRAVARSEPESTDWLLVSVGFLGWWRVGVVRCCWGCGLVCLGVFC